MSSVGGIQSTVAIKVLRADLGVNADAMRRLRDEGRLLARLHHPAILKVYDMVLLEERVTLVAEYIDGADLAEWNTRMPIRPLLQVIAAAAGALDAAYGAVGLDGKPLHLVHRDIKPSNIRIGRHGEVKVLDFGIAHFQGKDREARTDTGLVVGSLPYMAPERFSSPDVVPQSDIFSLGCTLYECLTGEYFLGDGNIRSVSRMALRRERFETHTDDQLARLGVDPRVLELVQSILAYDPDERPSADLVAARCEELADELAGPSLRTWCRSQSWPDPEVEEGPLVGRLITEGTIQISDGHVQTAQEGPVVYTSPQETLDRSLSTDGILTPSVGPSLLEHPYTEDGVKREIDIKQGGGASGLVALGCGGVFILAMLGVVIAVVVAAGAALLFA